MVTFPAAIFAPNPKTRKSCVTTTAPSTAASDAVGRTIEPLLLRAAEKYQIDMPRSFMVGDRWRDVEAGRVERPDEVDDAIREMIDTPNAVILDVVVDQAENCFPMIPSGAAHNEMLLGPEDEAKRPVSEEGMVLV